MKRSLLSKLLSVLFVVILCGSAFPCAAAFAQTPIDTVDVTVTEPSIDSFSLYTQIVTDKYISQNDLEGEVRQYNGIRWFEESGDSVTEFYFTNGKFKAGLCYTVTIALFPLNGYEFSDHVEATVNGSPASVEYKGDHIVVTRSGWKTDLKGNTLVDAIDITIPGPVVGNTPYYNQITTERVSSGGSVNAVNGISWTDSQTKERLDKTSIFEAGKTYDLSIYLLPNSGYVLSSAEIAGSINGQNAKISRSNYAVVLTLENIPTVEIPGAEISEVTVYIRHPVAGEHPSYAKIDADTYESGEKNSPGIFWLDESDVSTVYENQVFKLGRGYTFETVIHPKEGHFFSKNVTVNVNGYETQIETSSRAIRIITRFKALDKPVDTNVSHIELSVPHPVEGELSLTSFNNLQYASRNEKDPIPGQINGILWTNLKTSEAMTDGTFIAGCDYSFSVSLFPKPGFVFTDDLTVTVNGRPMEIERVDDHIIATYSPWRASHYSYFIDVEYDKWYTDGVLYCYYNGYLTGVSEYPPLFSPTMVFTRAMFVTMLARIDDADLSAYGKSTFTDIPEDTWYTKPVAWAVENGYTTGVGNGRFAPDDLITRESIAQFLFNYSKKKGYDVSASDDLSKFRDAANVSCWASDAVKWAVGSGFISGTSETMLKPRSTATRAQVALIAANYIASVKDNGQTPEITYSAFNLGDKKSNTSLLFRFDRENFENVSAEVTYMDKSRTFKLTKLDGTTYGISSEQDRIDLYDFAFRFNDRIKVALTFSVNGEKRIRTISMFPLIIY